MTIPPAIIDIRRMHVGRKKLRLWLPVFLLWPAVLLIVVVLSPVLLAFAIFYPFVSSVRRFFRGLRAAAEVICGSSGLIVSMRREDRAMEINIR